MNSGFSAGSRRAGTGLRFAQARPAGRRSRGHTLRNHLSRARAGARA